MYVYLQSNRIFIQVTRLSYIKYWLYMGLIASVLFLRPFWKFRHHFFPLHFSGYYTIIGLHFIFLCCGSISNRSNQTMDPTFKHVLNILYSLLFYFIYQYPWHGDQSFHAKVFMTITRKYPVVGLTFRKNMCRFAMSYMSYMKYLQTDSRFDQKIFLFRFDKTITKQLQKSAQNWIFFLIRLPFHHLSVNFNWFTGK
jgi:hypothetical protein